MHVKSFKLLQLAAAAAGYTHDCWRPVSIPVLEHALGSLQHNMEALSYWMAHWLARMGSTPNKSVRLSKSWGGCLLGRRSYVRGQACRGQARMLRLLRVRWVSQNIRNTPQNRQRRTLQLIRCTCLHLAYADLWVESLAGAKTGKVMNITARKRSCAVYTFLLRSVSTAESFTAGENYCSMDSYRTGW